MKEVSYKSFTRWAEADAEEDAEAERVEEEVGEDGQYDGEINALCEQRVKGVEAAQRGPRHTVCRALSDDEQNERQHDRLAHVIKDCREGQARQALDRDVLDGVRREKEGRNDANAVADLIGLESERDEREDGGWRNGTPRTSSSPTCLALPRVA